MEKMTVAAPATVAVSEYVQEVTGLGPVISWQEALTLRGQEVDGGVFHIQGVVWWDDGTLYSVASDGPLLHVGWFGSPKVGRALHWGSLNGGGFGHVAGH